MKITKRDKIQIVQNGSTDVAGVLQSLDQLMSKPSKEITRARAALALLEWDNAAKALTKALNQLAHNLDQQPLKLRPRMQVAIMLNAIGEFLGKDLSRVFTVKELREANVYGFGDYIIGSGGRHDKINQLKSARILEALETGKYYLTGPAIKYIRQNRQKNTK